MKIKFKDYMYTFGWTIKILYKASKKMFIFLLIINSILGLFVTVDLYIWKKIIDHIIFSLKEKNMAGGMLLLYVGIQFVVSSVKMIIKNLTIYIQSLYGEYVDKYLTELTLNKMETLPAKCYDNSEIYNLIQKTGSESLNRSMSLLQTLVQLIESLSSLVGIMAMLINFSRLSVLLCFVSTIPIFMQNNKIMNRWFEIFNNRFEKLRFANYLKAMCLRYENVKEIKIYNVAGYIKKKILNIYINNIADDKKIRKDFLKQTVKIKTIDIMGNYVIKLMIIFKVIKEKSTAGALVSYTSAIDILKDSLDNLMSMLSQTYEDILYMKNLFLLLHLKSEDEGKKREFKGEFSRIEFKNVSFKYEGGENMIIKNFSYTFYAGKTYGLVGLNGAGKTTLLKLLMNLYDVNEGVILIDGVDIRAYKKKSIYKVISAVFQDFIKYPFDVKSNILLEKVYNNKKNKEKLEEALDFVAAREFIRKLPNGLDTQLQKEWSESIELSLGQWQKIAIARAYVKTSQIMILDEPTASIDAVTEHEIFSKFNELKKNKLCILVTHRLANIQMVDEIIVLEDGKLIEAGTHRELLKTKGYYSQLFKMQAEGFKY